jgi:hypothetical protein
VCSLSIPGVVLDDYTLLLARADFASQGVCDGSASDFLSMTMFNILLLVASLAPVLIVGFLMMVSSVRRTLCLATTHSCVATTCSLVQILFGIIYEGRVKVGVFSKWFWPMVYRHKILKLVFPKISHYRARSLFLHWKNKVVFSLLSWVRFAAFIIVRCGTVCTSMM